jgi:hypothetical protein
MRQLSDIASVWQDEVIWTANTNWSPSPTQPKKPLKDGDIIIVRIGGRVFQYDSNTPDSELPRNFIVVRLKESAKTQFHPAFVAAHIERQIQAPTGPAALRGAVQQSTRVRGIRQIPVSGTTSYEEQTRWAGTRTATAQHRRSYEEIMKKLKLLEAAVRREQPDLRRIRHSRHAAARRFDGEAFIPAFRGNSNTATYARKLAHSIRTPQGDSPGFKARIITHRNGDWSLFTGGLRQRRLMPENRGRKGRGKGA